jgi:hypothetical protein
MRNIRHALSAKITFFCFILLPLAHIDIFARELVISVSLFGVMTGECFYVWFASFLDRTEEWFGGFGIGGLVGGTVVGFEELSFVGWGFFSWR